MKIIDNTKKYIALTFDDGPGKYTSRLVSYLNDGFAHATFFMQGSRLNSYKDAVKDVASSGSEIAYHSYKHKYFKDQTISEIKSDLDKSNNDLINITGESFKMVRPPYGSINDEIKKVLDMPVILWNVDTGDFRELYRHDNWVMSVCISSDDSMIISGGKDKLIPKEK